MDLSEIIVSDVCDGLGLCPICYQELGEHEEGGFPCDACTESQPMGEWLSSW